MTDRGETSVHLNVLKHKTKHGGVQLKFDCYTNKSFNVQKKNVEA